MRNPVWPFSCVTPAGTSNELDVHNEWEEKKITHTHTPWEDQREWHRMTRMTRPDCAVMCNLINTHTHTHTLYILKEEMRTHLEHPGGIV